MRYGSPAGPSRAPDSSSLGDGTFEDRTSSGVVPAFRRTWGGALFDYDNDGLPDIYLTTDFLPDTDQLLRNEGDFAFSDVTELAGVGNVDHGMGVAVTDIDADGWLDVYVTNWGVNALWRNLGGGGFYDAGQALQVAGGSGSSGWGLFFLDADNDGDEDLYVANGAAIMAEDSGTLVRPPVERNYLFLNQPKPGGEPIFIEAGREAGVADDGSGFGAAWGDLDGDGWLDIVVANRLGDSTRVFRNLGSTGARPAPLRIELEGSASSRDAWGARVTVEACGRRQVRLRSSGPSVLSAGEPTLHFGLGDCAEAPWVEVTWPDGTVEDVVLAAPAWGDAPVRLVEGDVADAR